jgi:putative inorganic carbon (HCO3(-)) transporter
MLHAHNLYLQFLLNLGVAGLVGFIWLVVKFFTFVKNCYISWSIPLTAAMVAILVHGLVDTPYWKNDLSYLFWVILALSVINSRTKTFAQ